MHVYKSDEPDIDFPQVDLLTYLFDHASTSASEGTVIHAEAANPSNCITKAETRLFIQKIAHVLRHDFNIGTSGVGKDVVLCTSSGNPFIPVFFYSIIAAGGVFSGASKAYTTGELTHQAKSGDARLLVCSEEFTDKTVATANACNIPLSHVLVLHYKTPKRWILRAVSDGYTFPSSDTPKLQWPRPTDPVELENTPICLLYSSGTTGLPKGVLLSHTNCVAACVCYTHFGAHHISHLKPRGRPFRYRTVAHLPIAHIAGIQNYSIQPLALGGATYWMPKYDFKLLLEYNRKYKTTHQFTVPPIWLDIAKSPQATDQFDTLEVAVTGAAPLGPELQAAVSVKLGKGSTYIGQTWGTTKTCGSITGQRWDVSDRTGSVGGLIANMRARIVDDDDKDVKVGEPGEMILQGPAVTKGYQNNIEATKAAFLDGWYRTGDVGFWKDGKIYIVDRKKELIKYKGLQVAPAELEALLISHPKILDAAVIGVQSKEHETEVPRAYVVPKQDDVPSEEELKNFVKENLALHKQLRGGVVFIGEIPKSGSGKILRKELRKRTAEDNALKARL